MPWHRLPPKSLLLFEAVINAVHRAVPGAFIAFNTRPEDSADAASRWLKGGLAAAGVRRGAAPSEFREDRVDLPKAKGK